MELYGFLSSFVETRLKLENCEWGIPNFWYGSIGIGVAKVHKISEGFNYKFKMEEIQSKVCLKYFWC